jgi:hypothetical protein
MSTKTLSLLSVTQPGLIIADFPIANFRFQIGNRHLAIGNEFRPLLALRPSLTRSVPLSLQALYFKYRWLG